MNLPRYNILVTSYKKDFATIFTRLRKKKVLKTNFRRILNTLLLYINFRALDPDTILKIDINNV